MRKITDAGTYSVSGQNVPIAYRGRSDRHNAGRVANVSRYADTNPGTGMEDLYAIMRKYSIKGFEFGNWVTQEERAEYVASLPQTLEDLYSVVGSRNLGFDRNVGIAFGARGSRGARAHYEPVLNMINLTREHGAGSLAHEYGHAIDYNFGGFVDQHKTYTALSGGYSIAASLPQNVGGVLRAYINQIVDSVRNGKNFAMMEAINKEREENGAKPLYSDYYFQRTEIFARFFEQYVCYCLSQRNTSSRLLVKSWTTYMSSYVYVERGDFLKIKPVADKLMKELVKFMNTARPIRAKAAPYPKPVIAKPDPEAKKIVKPKPTAAPKRKAATKEKGVKSLDEQFASIKKQHPDAILLFRCGDFYEAYKEDAKEVCKILCITLTHRGKTEACGFPFHALDTYLPKLVRAGKRVAIVDALEDPKNATGKVKRGVTEIVKPKETGKKKESSGVKTPKIKPLGGFVLTTTGKLCMSADVISKWGSDNIKTWKRIYLVRLYDDDKKATISGRFVICLKNGQYYYGDQWGQCAFDFNRTMAEEWAKFIHPAGALKPAVRKVGLDYSEYSFRDQNEAFYFAERTHKRKVDSNMHGVESKAFSMILSDIYESEYMYAKFPSRRGKAVAFWNHCEKPQNVDTITKK